MFRFAIVASRSAEHKPDAVVRRTRRAMGSGLFGYISADRKPNACLGYPQTPEDLLSQNSLSHWLRGIKPR